MMVHLERDSNVFVCQAAESQIFIEIDQNGLPSVLRAQKVLREVRNRPLLPREHFKSKTLKNGCK